MIAVISQRIDLIIELDLHLFSTVLWYYLGLLSKTVMAEVETEPDSWCMLMLKGSWCCISMHVHLAHSPSNEPSKSCYLDPYHKVIRTWQGVVCSLWLAGWLTAQRPEENARAFDVRHLWGNNSTTPTHLLYFFVSLRWAAHVSAGKLIHATLSLETRLRFWLCWGTSNAR